MVLIDGGMDPDLSILVAIQPILDSLGQKYPSFEAYLEFMRSTPFYTVWSPFWESCFYHDVEHRPDGSVVNKMCSRYIFQEMMAMHKVQVNQLHQKIKTPVLVQRASQGLGLPGVFMLTKKKAEEIAGLVPGSRLVTIENANHFDIVTRDETAREIEEFLAAS